MAVLASLRSPAKFAGDDLAARRELT